MVINERIEHFKVIEKNKSIVLESNRPLFRNRGLRHCMPDCKLIKNTVDFNVLHEAILRVVDSENLSQKSNPSHPFIQNAF